MATIRKRKNSYQIRVSTGYNASGEQVTVSKTWIPASNMTEKQIEKELQRQAVLFEEECLRRQITATAVKFEDFAERWFMEYAYIKLKPLTLKSYRNHTIRAYKSIGHLRLDRVTPRHIQGFILDLVKDNLSPKSIKNHVGFISTVMNYALKMQLISVNPCTLATLPRMNEVEHDLYTPEEVQHFLNLLSKETGSNFKYFIFFALLIFTGCRLGELLGLEWKDIDWENKIISIKRASYWTKELGTYTDTPKTKSSRRCLVLSCEMMPLLKSFQDYQNEQKAEAGREWKEHDRLFTRHNGEPMVVNRPYRFVKKFCEKHKLRDVTIHSFRHFFASVLISNGVDVKTIQGILGHSTPITTLSIYCHELQNSQAKAIKSISNIISLAPAFG